jgi:hypothetical protein
MIKTVYKCDLCGTTISKDQWHASAIQNSDVTKNYSHTDQVNTPHGWRVVKHYILCKECINAVIELRDRIDE